MLDINQLQIKKVRTSIFFILLFSLMAYSVLFSTLILFITNKLKIEERQASDLTSLFLTLHFTLQIIGGALSGNLLSHRLLLSIGLFLQVIGCCFLAFYNLNWGLAFFLGGTGFTLVCINSILNHFFLPHDKGRERAFLYNYSAMNLGVLIGITISGFFELNQNYNFLFFFAALADLIALSVLLFRWKTLKDYQTFFSTLPSKKKPIYLILGITLIVILLLFLRWITENYSILNHLVIVTGIAVISIIIYTALKEKEETVRKRLWAYLIFILTGVVFWTLYLMLPLALMIFVQNDVQRNIFGITIPPQWTINITTLIVIIAGPILAKYFKKYRERGGRITITSQFISSLFAMTLAFICLSASIALFSGEKMNLSFIVISFILIGIGEVLFSPIGQAMVGQLIAPKMQSIATGVWFLAIAVGAVFANIFSKLGLYTAISDNTQHSNEHFLISFSILALAALLTALVLLLLSKKINRWIEEKQIQP